MENIDIIDALFQFNKIQLLLFEKSPICEFFIDIPKSYIFIICERALQEKTEIYNSNKFLIQVTKYLAYIGAIKGIIAILLAIYSFVNFMLNDNINLSGSDEKKPKKENTAKKKNE